MNRSSEIEVFCKNVQFLRVSNGLSQKEMAKILHMSVKTLKSLERGVLPDCVGVDVVMYLDKHFGIKPSQQFECLQENREAI